MDSTTVAATKSAARAKNPAPKMPARPQADRRSANAAAVELEERRVLATLHGDDDERDDLLLRPVHDHPGVRRRRLA
ncbi:MAG TPA: hypothetical protein VKZ81_02945 [Pseudonocardia sp.]|jgi:hypothetical protein|uniref:hypothetical protein n=1 Tax=Pseudonocardia sp. TaxID=60912 RepID=UPI002B4B662B|nr:hypothetical protein [Pseudonocardia sp.]HLU54393.1 hypothetical protein [Pseudonocardia sp.]